MEPGRLASVERSVSLQALILRVAREVSWAPLTIIILHAIAGKVFGHEPYVDPVMHFLGGVAVAFFLRQTAIIAAPLLGTLKPLTLDLLAFGLSCTATLYWEIGEYIVDLVFGTNIQISKMNTMRDLILGQPAQFCILHCDAR